MKPDPAAPRPTFTKQACGHITRAWCKSCLRCFACCLCEVARADPEEGREELRELIRHGLMTLASDKLSMEEIATCAYAISGAWTARAARERELRHLVADLRAHNVQGPSDVTGPVSEALNHIADRIEAALSETQPKTQEGK